MMQPSTSSRVRFPAILAAMAMVAIVKPVQAHAYRSTHHYVVRCTSVQQPVQSSHAWEGVGNVLAHDVSVGRFFAPIRQAVFYSHAGDRCLWHAGALARG